MDGRCGEIAGRPAAAHNDHALAARKTLYDAGKRARAGLFRESSEKEFWRDAFRVTVEFGDETVFQVRRQFFWHDYLVFWH